MRRDIDGAPSLLHRLLWFGCGAGIAAGATYWYMRQGSPTSPSNDDGRGPSATTAAASTEPKEKKGADDGHVTPLSTATTSTTAAAGVPEPSRPEISPLNLSRGGGAGVASSPSEAQAPSAVALSPRGVTYFPLARRRRVNHNAVLLTFELPDPEQCLGLKAGQHVTVCIATPDESTRPRDGGEGGDAAVDDAASGEGGGGGGGGGAVQAVRRAYTPVTPPDVRGTFDLLVKVYPTGTVSRYLGSLSVGDVVAFSGPGGRFIYRRGDFARLGMVCGGSGVTPMLQIMRAIADDPEDTTEVSLIYANVTEEDIMLRDELDDVVRRIGAGRASVYHVLNDPPTGWEGGVGFVSAEMIRERMPPPAEDNSTRLLFCGPLPMVKAMQDHAKSLGYPRRAIYKF